MYSKSCINGLSSSDDNPIVLLATSNPSANLDDLSNPEASFDDALVQELKSRLSVDYFQQLGENVACQKEKAPMEPRLSVQSDRL